MAIAVLLAESTDNIDGLPIKWPVKARNIGDRPDLPPEYNPREGWLWFADDAALAAHKALHQAEYDTWLAAQEAAEQEVDIALQNIDRGREIIAGLSAQLVRLQASPEYRADLMSAISDILVLLTVGQLDKARSVAQALQPSGKLTQNMIDKLRAFLGREI